MTIIIINRLALCKPTSGLLLCNDQLVCNKTIRLLTLVVDETTMDRAFIQLYFC